jgi:hypothetical protein
MHRSDFKKTSRRQKFTKLYLYKNKTKTTTLTTVHEKVILNKTNRLTCPFRLSHNTHTNFAFQNTFHETDKI